MHNANLLELSTDLPIVVEIIDSNDNIERLKHDLEANSIVDGVLITEEKVTTIRFGE